MVLHMQYVSLVCHLNGDLLKFPISFLYIANIEIGILSIYSIIAQSGLLSNEVEAIDNFSILTKPSTLHEPGVAWKSVNCSTVSCNQMIIITWGIVCTEIKCGLKLKNELPLITQWIKWLSQ